MQSDESSGVSLFTRVRKHHDRMTELLRHAAMAYHFRKLNESYGDT